MRIRPTARRLATDPFIAIVGVALLTGCGKTTAGATPSSEPSDATMSESPSAMATN